MTFATVNERVENRRTSPDCDVVEGADDADAPGDVGFASGYVGEGTGDGYAR